MIVCECCGGWQWSKRQLVFVGELMVVELVIRGSCSVQTGVIMVVGGQMGSG
jgi:hypothetical protein